MRFIVLWITGKHTIIEGDDIVAACVNARIGSSKIPKIYSYAKESDVAGNVKCECTHHAESGAACRHDISAFWRGGVNSESFEAYYPQLTPTEIEEIVYKVSGKDN